MGGGLFQEGLGGGFLEMMRGMAWDYLQKMANLAVLLFVLWIFILRGGKKKSGKGRGLVYHYTYQKEQTWRY